MNNERKETNRYGEELKRPTLEQVIADLEALSAEMVLAICASLLITHNPYNCLEVVANIKKSEGDKL